MIVNQVISRDLGSRIFRDLFRRLERGVDGIEIVVSEKPIATADVYHYHRPHLETKLHRPSLVTVHHDLADQDEWLSRSRFAAHYLDADAVICLNSLQRARLELQGVARARLIPHGYDQDLFKRRTSARRFSKSRKITLGMVSRRYGRRVKGEVLLYELMQRIDPERFRFVFVGEGRSADASAALALGFEARAFEFLPYRLFPQAYHEFDFLLMLSVAEGGPASVPEAVASGVPLLSMRVGMAADLVEDGVNGRFLSGRADEDAKTFADIAKNHDRAYAKLAAGAMTVETAITWAENHRRHANLYRELVSIAA